MENLTQSLLESYYGFGGDKKEGKTLASHEGYQRELDEEKAVIAAGNGDSNGEETMGARQNLETQIDDSKETNGAGADPVDQFRFFNDDILNEEFPDDDEVDLEVGHPMESTDDGRAALPKLLVPEKTDGKEETTELGVVDDGAADSASDISTLSTKKKRKKSRLSTSGANEPQPLILMPPLSRKNPTITKEFCDMTNASIIEFPVDLLDEISNIRMLYLENNCLNELPDQLFTTLHFLQWLDVRNNWLKTLPETIKHHLCLDTLLLQGNRIEKLPLELCLVPNLKSLHTAGNPLACPPKDVIAKGFTSIMNFLRKEWNEEHPNEVVTPPREVKSTLTVLCDDPPILSSSRSSRSSSSSKFQNHSTTALSCSLRTPSVREKSRNYKPSNRYNELHTREYDLLELNYRSKLNESPDILCDDCREKMQNSSTYSSRPDEWDCFIDFQQIKIRMRGRPADGSEMSATSGTSTPTRRDVGVVADIEYVEEKKSKSVRLPKINESNFISDVKRLEDIKVKERVYKVMTNDRIMTKLRPMRLNDPDWILGFIENYLGVENRPMGCRSSGNSLLEEKLRWISKVREMLIKQAAEIQRLKDRESLREWRRDRKSFDKSMEKAANRTLEAIPLHVDSTDTAFLNKKITKSPLKKLSKKNIRLCGDMDRKISEISETLEHYHSKIEPEPSNSKQLQILQSEIRRIENLYEEIQALKRQNDVSSKKYSGPNIPARSKAYKQPPSIIV